MLSVSANNSKSKTEWKVDARASDPGNPRTLNGASYTDGTSMTEDSCVSYCKGKNYTYAGTEFSEECC